MTQTSNANSVQFCTLDEAEALGMPAEWVVNFRDSGQNLYHTVAKRLEEHLRRWLAQHLPVSPARFLVYQNEKFKAPRHGFKEVDVLIDDATQGCSVAEIKTSFQPDILKRAKEQLRQTAEILGPVRGGIFYLEMLPESSTMRLCDLNELQPAAMLRYWPKLQSNDSFIPHVALDARQLWSWAIDARLENSFDLFNKAVEKAQKLKPLKDVEKGRKPPKSNVSTDRTDGDRQTAAPDPMAAFATISAALSRLHIDSNAHARQLLQALATEAGAEAEFDFFLGACAFNVAKSERDLTVAAASTGRLAALQSLDRRFHVVERYFSLASGRRTALEAVARAFPTGRDCADYLAIRRLTDEAHLPLHFADTAFKNAALRSAVVAGVIQAGADLVAMLQPARSSAARKQL